MNDTTAGPAGFCSECLPNRPSPEVHILVVEARLVTEYRVFFRRSKDVIKERYATRIWVGYPTTGTRVLRDTFIRWISDYDTGAALELDLVGTRRLLSYGIAERLKGVGAGPESASARKIGRPFSRCSVGNSTLVLRCATVYEAGLSSSAAI